MIAVVHVQVQKLTIIDSEIGILVVYTLRIDLKVINIKEGV